MKRLTMFSQMAVLAGAVLMISGCAVYPAQYGQGYGPPSRAPAHGYRYNHQGHDAVYDPALGVYVVVGLQNYYLYNDSYYRYDRGQWYSSRNIDRGWHNYSADKLPPGLAKKYGHRGDDRRNSRGNSRHD